MAVSPFSAVTVKVAVPSVSVTVAPLAGEIVALSLIVMVGVMLVTPAGRTMEMSVPVIMLDVGRAFDRDCEGFDLFIMAENLFNLAENRVAIAFGQVAL